MRYLVVIFTVAVGFFAAFGQFYGERIPVLDAVEVMPSLSDVHGGSSESLPIADTLPRYSLAFDFPRELFSDSTAIIEAFLLVKIEPVIHAEVNPFDVYFVPLSGDLSDARRISESDFRYAVAGIYDPDSGEVFFEISPVLRAIRDGEISARRFALVPGGNGVPFRLSGSVSEAISLRCEYRPGKRNPETRE